MKTPRSERDKRYREKNKEIILAKQKAYYQNNAEYRERVKEMRKKWNAENKERVKELARLRRERILADPELLAKEREKSRLRSEARRRAKGVLPKVPMSELEIKAKRAAYDAKRYAEGLCPSHYRKKDPSEYKKRGRPSTKAKIILPSDYTKEREKAYKQEKQRQVVRTKEVELQIKKLSKTEEDMIAQFLAKHPEKRCA